MYVPVLQHELQDFGGHSIPANQELLWNNPLPFNFVNVTCCSRMREGNKRLFNTEHFKPHMDKLAKMEKGTTILGGA